MTSWNHLPPPLKDWDSLSTQSFRITCSAAWDQQAWSPWRSKKQSWFSPNCPAALLGGGQHICMLLSRHVQTDWQFLGILQKTKIGLPGVYPCKHSSVVAPGWKRVLEKLGTEWGYPFGSKGRGELATQEYQFIVAVVYGCCLPAGGVGQDRDKCCWGRACLPLSAAVWPFISLLPLQIISNFFFFQLYLTLLVIYSEHDFQPHQNPSTFILIFKLSLIHSCSSAFLYAAAS